MSHHDTRRFRAPNPLRKPGSIAVRQIKTILSSELLHQEWKLDAGSTKQLREDCLDDLILTQGIEVLLVDRATRGDDQYRLFRHAYSPIATPRFGSRTQIFDALHATEWLGSRPRSRSRYLAWSAALRSSCDR